MSARNMCFRGEIRNIFYLELYHDRDNNNNKKKKKKKKKKKRDMNPGISIFGINEDSRL